VAVKTESEDVSVTKACDDVAVEIACKYVTVMRMHLQMCLKEMQEDDVSMWNAPFVKARNAS
jgi:hypothetical protein